MGRKGNGGGEAESNLLLLLDQIWLVTTVFRDSNNVSKKKKKRNIVSELRFNLKEQLSMEYRVLFVPYLGALLSFKV